MKTHAPLRANAAFDEDLASLTRLADLVSDGLVVADQELRVRLANEEACRMLHATTDWVLGRAASEVLPTAVEGEDVLAEAKAGKPATRETLLLTREGVEVPAQVTTTRLPSGGSVAVLRDLTNAQRLARELRLRERLATVGELAAGVAHEIRNPLAGISSSAQVLLTRFEPRDDRQKFCRVIIEQVDRLDRIVTSLLKFARPPEPALRLGRIEDVVDRILDLEAERLAEAKIQVERRVAARLPSLYLDPGLLEQVLLNLVVNAVQAMPGGGTLTFDVAVAAKSAPPRPRARGRRASDLAPPIAASSGAAAVPSIVPTPAADAAGGGVSAAGVRVVRVRVMDTGVGIPREVLPRLFDPFFTTKAGGTGLGLSISQSIIQEHGGTISVASREGRGTTVVVELPLEKRHGQRRQDAR
jgi:two-component system sensor histidine kinase HydH